jgi:hypothetical protein
MSGHALRLHDSSEDVLGRRGHGSEDLQHSAADAGAAAELGVEVVLRARSFLPIRDVRPGSMSDNACG